MSFSDIEPTKSFTSNLPWKMRHQYPPRWTRFTISSLQTLGDGDDLRRKGRVTCSNTLRAEFAAFQPSRLRLDSETRQQEAIEQLNKRYGLQGWLLQCFSSLRRLFPGNNIDNRRASRSYFSFSSRLASDRHGGRPSTQNPPSASTCLGLVCSAASPLRALNPHSGILPAFRAHAEMDCTRELAASLEGCRGAMERPVHCLSDR